MNQATGSSVEVMSCLAVTEDLLHFQVKDHPFRLVPLNSNESPADEADHVDIRVIGIGTLGTNVVQLLARNVSSIWCHEILRSGDGPPSTDLPLLLSSIKSSHLVFIVTGFDDEYCEAAAQVVGTAAVDAGVLTLVATQGRARDMSRKRCEQSKWYDAMFSVSGHSLPHHDGSVPFNPASLTEYTVRHAVATITNLMTHRTGICIDFADIVSIMNDGHSDGMGLGIGSGAARGATAAIHAMEQLAAQGMDISSATGILAAVHGSGDVTMEDFDAASMVIHDHASDDATILVGLIGDEQLGGNVKATVLTVHHTKSATGVSGV